MDGMVDGAGWRGVREDHGGGGGGPSAERRPTKVRITWGLGQGTRGGSSAHADGAAAAARRAMADACPWCCVPCQMGTAAARAAAARHINRAHGGAVLSAKQVEWIGGRLLLCVCGRLGISAACDCADKEATQRPPAEGDTVRLRFITARRQAASAAAAKASVVRAARADDATLAGALLNSLELDTMREIVTELEQWPGAETTVHIPAAVRPELAEIVATLIGGMVDGSVVAGLLMKALPKLVLHSAGIKDLGTAAAIRERIGILMETGPQALMTRIRNQRTSPAGRGKKREREGGEPKVNYGKVKGMARDGAFSKAIRRLDVAEVPKYSEEELRKWADLLIPRTPSDAADLGARAIETSEPAHWKSLQRNAHPKAAAAAGLSGEEGCGRPDNPMLGDYAKGVRFPALSAPGPSGLRPEHLRELALCRKVSSRQAFQRAMDRFVAAGIKGALNAEATRWITESAVTFLKKPGAVEGAAPRPIRVGEVLRRWVAKRIAAMEKSTLGKLFARGRQFGVACPGGVEVLAHHRRVTCGGDVGGDVGDWDIDLKNCYGNLFWGAIDASVARHAPNALPWTRWLHSGESRVFLPGGLVHRTDRGAEQGDPLGGLYAAAVILDACEEAGVQAMAVKDWLGSQEYKTAVMSAGVVELYTRVLAMRNGGAAALTEEARMQLSRPRTPPQDHSLWDLAIPARASTGALQTLDVWYIDDGHMRGNLVDGDLWLAAFDACGVGKGIVRSETKSLFRHHDADTPAPPYTAVTCMRRDPAAAVKYLGVEIGREREQFAQKVQELAALHRKIRQIDDPAVELVLTQQCADVGKVMHLLRAVGPSVDGLDGLDLGSLEAMDEVMNECVSSVTRAAASPETEQQARWGVKQGGLGFRPGTVLALPAHLASLLEAKPFVEAMAKEMASRGIGVARRIGDVVDAVKRALVSGNVDKLVSDKLELQIDKATSAIEAAAALILGPPHPPVAPVEGGAAGSPARGSEVKEDVVGNRRRLQHALVTTIERRDVDGVLAELEKSDNEHNRRRHRRLCDLGDERTNHEWLSAINPAHGPTLTKDQYILALRLRLGVPVTTYEGVAGCRECSKTFSAAEIGDHALCCAKGRSVMGHNRIRDHLADLARISDPGTATEVAVGEALLGDDDRAKRPADVLTCAAPFGGGDSMAALDIGVSCPHSTDAIASRNDHLAAYDRRKRLKYSDIASTAGWVYKPVIISCFGRPHSDASTIISQLASAAARKYGLDSQATIEERWWRNCSTLLAMRTASMVSRCLPAAPLERILGDIDEADVDNANDEADGPSVDSLKEVEKVVVRGGVGSFD